MILNPLMMTLCTLRSTGRDTLLQFVQRALAHSSKMSGLAMKLEQVAHIGILDLTKSLDNSLW